MDEKDFRILVEVFRHPLANHAQLGRAANVSAASAERRLVRMQEEFVLAGFFALPTASTLGREAFTAVANAARSQALFPARLLGEQDVVWVVRKNDGAVTMCLYLVPGADPASIGLTREAGWEVTRSHPGPPLARPLSEADGRIIDALIDHPRAEITELARRTGLPARTVKDRRDTLLEKNLFEVRPVVLAPQGAGPLVFQLHVRLASVDAAPKVRSAIDRGLVIQETQAPPALLFLCRAFTVPGVYDLQKRIAALPEVKEVVFTINREAAIARDRLHGWVREAVDRS